MGTKELYLIRVTGKVQGVFYRKYTLQKARELGLNGFVRNVEDGSVYIEAEGKAEQLDQLVEWCKEGSPSAEVDKVDYRPEVLKNHGPFQIVG